jgi:putative copper export protein
VRSNPNWRHRRRLIYATVGLAFGMIVFGAFVWRDGMVASELVRSGTILVTTVLTGYVFGAVADDYFQKGNDHGE